MKNDDYSYKYEMYEICELCGSTYGEHACMNDACPVPDTALWSDTNTFKLKENTDES